MALLIDADDTLWENITVFHEINERYLSWVSPERDPVAAQAELDALQIRLVLEHGYGRNTFALGLLEGLAHFAGRQPSASDQAKVAELVEPLQWESLDLIAGVEATLPLLAERIDLIMVTKGDLEEQTHKVETSGLAGHFHAIEIVPEKHPEAYLDVVHRHELDPSNTKMVGNSPKSDIVPALQAGIGAIHIPHAQNWVHDHSEMPEDHPRLTRINSFAELIHHL